MRFRACVVAVYANAVTFSTTPHSHLSRRHALQKLPTQEIFPAVAIAHDADSVWSCCQDRTHAKQWDEVSPPLPLHPTPLPLPTANTHTHTHTHTHTYLWLTQAYLSQNGIVLTIPLREDARNELTPELLDA